MYSGSCFGEPCFSPVARRSSTNGLSSGGCSQDGTKVLMIVEPCEKKYAGFWDPKHADAATNVAANKFTYEPDFGEKLVGKTNPALAVFDWQNDDLQQLELELCEGHHPAYVAWSPDGAGALVTVYDVSKFKHGLSACLNRPTHIRHIPDLSKPQVRCQHSSLWLMHFACCRNRLA